MAGRPHRLGDEGGMGLPVGGKSAGVGRGSIRGKAPRIAKAKKAAKARVSKAKAKVEKQKKERKRAKRSTASTEKFEKRDVRKSPKTEKAKHQRKLAAPTHSGAAYREGMRSSKGRVMKADGTPAYHASVSNTRVERSGHRLVDAKKALKRARTTASPAVKTRGGGRRTHFLGGQN